MSRIRNNSCEHTYLEVLARSSFFLIDLELELGEKARWLCNENWKTIRQLWKLNVELARVQRRSTLSAGTRSLTWSRGKYIIIYVTLLFRSPGFAPSYHAALQLARHRTSQVSSNVDFLASHLLRSHQEKSPNAHNQPVSLVSKLFNQHHTCRRYIKDHQPYTMDEILKEGRYIRKHGNVGQTGTYLLSWLFCSEFSVYDFFRVSAKSECWWVILEGREKLGQRGWKQR